MASVTYYVALPFLRDDDGGLVAGEAQERQTASAAVRAAASIARTSVRRLPVPRSGT